MTQQPATIPQVDVTEADRRRREGAPASLIVDVREPNEAVVARVEGAVLFPLSTFAARFEELPKDRPLLLMCAAGSRSLAATAHLLRNGWTDVANVVGGIDAWQAAGLPVKHGPLAPDEGALPGS